MAVRSRITGASFGEDATLVREAPGARNEYGEWVPGAPVETAIRVTWQPAPGKDRWSNFARVVEEGGLRLEGLAVVYATVELFAAGDGTTGDIVSRGGTRHRVRAVEAWPGFWAALVERIEPQSGG